MAKRSSFDYFDSFKKQADLAVEEADALIDAIQNFTHAEDLKPALDAAHAIENNGDIINHEIFHNTALDFITPIEREDIISLAQNLDSVIDDIEDVMIRFYMFNIPGLDKNALAFAETIKEACVALSAATAELRNYKKAPKDIQQRIVKVNDAEEAGDRLYLSAIRSLYLDHSDDPLYVNVWSQIYSKMEKCCDACEHAADSVSMVLLKNS